MTGNSKPTGSYEIGHGKPPKECQFKSGQSGNPKGRPKGTKNLRTDLLEELGETMKVREGNHEHRISKQRALIKTLVARALKGNDRAAAKVLDLYLRVVGIVDDAKDAKLPLGDDERAVMQAFENRVRRRAGIAAPKSDGKSPDNNGDDGETS